MSKHFNSRLIGPLVLAGSAALSACGGGGGGGGSGTASSGSGTLAVSLTDAPACGFDAVNVTVDRVRVHSSADATGAPGEAGWSEIVLSPPRQVDLLELVNGVLFELGQVALPAGTYQQIRLVLADNAVLPMANSVVPSGGSRVALTTPSGQQSGIKLQANIEVPAGETADVVLDFDACRSIVKRGNSGSYNLKPVVSVIPLVSAGSISGHVDPALLADGISITAQSAGETVKATVPDASGAFRLYPVASGAYDVVLSANARGTRVVSGVPVVTGGNAVLASSAQPLALNPSATGEVTGTVAPALAQAEVRALQSAGASLRIEVARQNADALTGGYAFALPLADLELAQWGTGALPLGFSALAGTGGRYVIEAQAPGYLPAPAVSSVLTLGSATVVQDFDLTAAP